MKTLDLDISIESIVESMTVEQRSEWEKLNGMELSLALAAIDKGSLLASLLEIML